MPPVSPVNSPVAEKEPPVAEKQPTDNPEEMPPDSAVEMDFTTAVEHYEKQLIEEALRSSKNLQGSRKAIEHQCIYRFQKNQTIQHRLSIEKNKKIWTILIPLSIIWSIFFIFR